MFVSKRKQFIFIIVLLQTFALIGCNSKSGELPQEPQIETEEQDSITLPSQAAQQIYMTANEMLMDIIYGRTSVNNGLESLQSRIQHILDQAWGG